VIVAWLLYPLVALVLCLGCGLAVQRCSGMEIPGTILPGVGLLTIIVIASLAVTHEFTARFALPAVLVVAVAGYVLGFSRLRTLRPDPLPLAAAFGVFCVCAAPMVLSGNATFAGYFVLNDGVFHFSLIHQLLSHGHDLSRLSLSSYSALLNDYLSTSYPTGADLPIGVFGKLVGQDVAWLFQPEQALMMAFGSAAVWELLSGVVASRRLRALVAFLAAQAALLYAYYLEASIKEVATTWVITTTLVLVVVVLRRGERWRAAIPLVIAAAGGYYVLGAAIAPWIAVPLVGFVLVVAWRLRHRAAAMSRQRLAVSAAAIIVIGGGLLALVIDRALNFAHVAEAVLTQPGVLGNLFTPLPKWQMFGIWPSDDFRVAMTAGASLTYALIGAAIVSGFLGVAWAVRRRLWPPLLLLAGNGIAVIYLLHRADPYAAGKVMMIFSLTAILTAMLGPAALHDAGRRIEAWGLALLIAFGVLWSNALAYHGAAIAPRAPLQELASIDTRFAGQGPAFFNLSNEYATYFLRDLAPVDPAVSPPAARTAAATPQGRDPWDPDDLPLSTIEGFRLLVIGDPALTSRPPSNFKLVYADRYYDVWRRASGPDVLAHYALGGPLYPVARASCRLVRTAAALARRDHARLAYDARVPVPLMAPGLSPDRPPNWGEVGGDPYSLIPRSEPGAVAGKVTLPSSGRYEVEAEGSISETMPISVDGHMIGALSDELGPPGQLIPIAPVTLSKGTHQVSVLRPGNTLAPGDAATGQLLGPVVFVRQDTSAVGTVSEISPSRAQQLCGQSLDWIEVVRA
jgi:hypothetical protein